ncbi:MAG: DUF5317 domain-containing protein [Bacillota bacterium]|nr:DUF5317 domain-containing protein [Bacillota bacterium]
MNLLVVALSLLVGLLRGYRIGDLFSHRFRGMPLFFGSLAIQLILGTARAEATLWIRAAAPLLNLGSMGLLVLALILNHELWGARFAALGVFANVAVIFANGGKMPVSTEALRSVGMPASRVAYLIAGRSLVHRPMRPGTALWFLGDLLYLPPPIVRSAVFSIGDIILAGGVFLLIQDAMSKSAALRRQGEETAG